MHNLTAVAEGSLTLYLMVKHQMILFRWTVLEVWCWDAQEKSLHPLKNKFFKIPGARASRRRDVKIFFGKVMPLSHVIFH